MENSTNENANQSKVWMDSVGVLLDSLSSDKSNWDKHRELCLMILEMFNECSVHSLDEQFIDRVLEQLEATVRLCEDTDTVLSAMKAIVKCPLSKVEFFMLKFITTDQLRAQEDESYKRENMIRAVLSEHRDSLNEQVTSRYFDYLSKTIYNRDVADSEGAPTKLASSFPQLIDIMSLDMETDGKEWFRHESMNKVFQQIVLAQHQDGLDQKAIDQMFEHCEKFVQKCKNGVILFKVIYTFKQFPLSKIEFMLPKLMDSIESVFEGDQKTDWNRHQSGVVLLIADVLRTHRDSLSEQVNAHLFDYLAKIVQNYEDPTEACETFACFSLTKLESSLPQLMDSMELDLSADTYVWFKHQNMGKVIGHILNENVDSLHENVIDRMFEYCSKLIHHCDRATFISFAISAFVQFPLRKLEVLLLPLMRSLEDELDGEQYEWYRHSNMAAVIHEVLGAYQNLLNQSVIDRMFDYCTKLILKSENLHLNLNAICALSKFPLTKLECSLTKLIDSMENELLHRELNTEWYRHRNMVLVIVEVLKVHCGQLSEQVTDCLFGYLDKLIHADEDNKTDVTDAFQHFSLKKLESSLPQLMGSMKLDLDTDTDADLCIHQNINHAIFNVLNSNHQDSFDKSVIDQIFEYNSKFVLHFDDERVIYYAIYAFPSFPLSKLEHSLPQMIRSLEGELDGEQEGEQSTGWYRHENMAWLIQAVLSSHSYQETSLAEAVIDCMFEYCTKLVQKSEVERAIEALEIIEQTRALSSSSRCSSLVSVARITNQ